MPATTVTTRAVKGSALTHTEMDQNLNNLNNVGIGIGHISMWPTATPPDSTWLECDGRSLSTGTYPDLFNVIGYMYGGGGTAFNIPDYRALFLRGWDHGRGADPDRGSRNDRGDGVTGDNIGTKQWHQAQLVTHWHTYAVPQDEHGKHTGPWPAWTGRDGTDGVYNGRVGSDGDSFRYTQVSTMDSGNNEETRPVNINVMFIIKAMR